MSNIFITFFAYFIDKIFGEFKFIKHPVVYIGELITFFENRYYQKTISRGIWLVVFVVLIMGLSSFLLAEFLSYLTSFLDIVISSIFASMFISHKMLRNAVKDVLISQDKRHTISMLMSNDTDNMSDSDIYKSAIETYAQNLSNGVIGPMLYLLFFGLPGIIVYKAINVMASMHGSKKSRYLKYGRASIMLDDILNYLPSRLTAVLIMFISGQKDVLAFYKNGMKHENPNIGHPISAMALALSIRLGGNTKYLGKLKKKPYFGRGRKIITEDDLRNAINLFAK